MTVDKIEDEGQVHRYPSGTIVGIVETQDVLEGLTQALENAGINEIQFLSGEEGIRLLDRVNESHFSDMEDRIFARHREALKEERIIVVIGAPSERVDEVVEIATQNGADGLVHFGWAMVTWLTK